MPSFFNPNALADEIATACAERRTIVVPPSNREAGLTLTEAYQVEAELARRRRAAGRSTVGRKVGFASKAVWRVMGLETVVWASMYDDTVQYAQTNQASLSIGGMFAPKIEPEIIVKMKTPLGAGGADQEAVLAAVEWIALGYEIIDCVYADWKFQPVDFVAAYGFHAGLIVGAPQPIDRAMIPRLAEALVRFTVRLCRNGQLVEEGSGRNVLRSPALCLAELASAIEKRPGAEPLAAGELVSTGTLTTSCLIAPGETWTASAEGLDVPALTVHIGES